MRLAVADGLAGVAVLVDQAVHAPGQVVLQRIGGKSRQRADPHLDVVQRVEALRQVVGDDADEARRQAALRHEGGGCAVGQLLDGAGGGHVLGQVEVVAAGGTRQRGGGQRQVVGQRIDHGIVAAQRRQQRRLVFGVDLAGGDAGPRHTGQRLRVLVDQADLVVAGGGQQAGDGLADVASAEQGDVHGGLRGQGGGNAHSLR